ncbi:unnamed protein product, partial [Effrenium voratum]
MQSTQQLYLPTGSTYWGEARVAFPLWPEQALRAHAAMDDLDDLFSSDTEDEEAARAKFARKLEEAKLQKEEGNQLLKRGDAKQAEVAYRKGLASIWAPYRQREAEAAALGAALDLNLALCHLRLEQWEQACRCTSRALEVEPFNGKALYRRGLARHRLGLLQAAEEDLQGALKVAPSAEARQELAAVQKQRGEDTKIPSGFLKKTEAVAKEQALEPEERPAEESDWAVTEQVQDALQEAHDFLLAIAERHVACRSQEEVAALCEQLDQVAALVPRVKGALEAATLVPAPLSTPPVCEVQELVEALSAKLVNFRPFFQQQERKVGEFESLRVCRQLGELPHNSRWYSFDVELVRWGDSKAATPADFAAPLFPPTGEPSASPAAAWQREIFHRIFMKDASKHVAGALFLLLREQLGRLRLQGRLVEDLGLAHGMFFAPLAPHGPAEGQSEAARRNSLAICSGEDRRLIAVPSFTSLGCAHKWLLLKVGDEEGEVYALDPCCGALGLLNECSGLSRLWPMRADERFVVRASAFGEAALGLLGHKTGEALKALTQGDGLSTALKAMEAASNSRPPELKGLAEAAARLQVAAQGLGLPATAAATEEELDAAHKAAVEELVRRKLRAYGFEKLADQIGPPRLVSREVLEGLDVTREAEKLASWRFNEEDEDKRSLLDKLRSTLTRPKELAETVAALQQRRLLTEAREYTLVIKVLGQLGLWREAVGMLVDMERKGVSPDVITYNAAIMALSRNKRWKEAIELVAEMWDAKIIPDVISYTSAISACASTGHWKEALQLLAEMERAGIRADVRIFNAAINACAQAGESQRALQLLDGMPERKLTPDVITYNAAINACARSGEWKQAIQLIQRMKEQGLKPQTRTYNSAINACEKAFRGEEALQLLQDMADSQVRPDAVTFNTAISACLKGGLRAEALDLLEEMRGLGIPMDVISYSVALRAVDTWEYALQLMSEMPDKAIMPDNIVYGAAMGAFDRGRNLALALRFLQNMRLSGLQPDLVILNS